MKFFAALNLVILSAMPSFAQDTLRAYYTNGQIRYECVMRNGKPEGLYRNRYPDGQRQSEACYKNGLHNGTLKTWYPDGKRELVSLLVNEYALRNRSYDSTGRLTSFIRRSSKGSVRKIWGNKGGPVFIEKFRNGVPVECVNIAPLPLPAEGTNDPLPVPVQIRCSFMGVVVTEKNGVYSDSTGQVIPQRYRGYIKTRYDDGKKQSRGRYRNGQRHGVWTEWNTNGTVIRKEIYRQGILKKEGLH